MTDKQKIDTLSRCFREVIWMSIRQATTIEDCRIIEDSIKEYKSLFPDWEIRKDKVVQEDEEHLLSKSIIWEF